MATWCSDADRFFVAAMTYDLRDLPRSGTDLDGYPVDFPFYNKLKCNRMLAYLNELPGEDVLTTMQAQTRMKYKHLGTEIDFSLNEAVAIERNIEQTDARGIKQGLLDCVRKLIVHGIENYYMVQHSQAPTCVLRVRGGMETKIIDFPDEEWPWTVHPGWRDPPPTRWCSEIPAAGMSFSDEEWWQLEDWLHLEEKSTFGVTCLIREPPPEQILPCWPAFFEVSGDEPAFFEIYSKTIFDSAPTWATDEQLIRAFCLYAQKREHTWANGRVLLPSSPMHFRAPTGQELRNLLKLCQARRGQDRIEAAIEAAAN